MSDEPENNPDGEPGKEPTKLSFSVPQLVGSAAAAMTVAYVGSSLGTAGTIFGAALASVIGAIAGTVYTAGLDHTGRRLGSVMQRGWTRIRRADPGLDEADAPEAEVDPSAGPASGDDEPQPDKGRTWRHIALRVLTATAAIFALSFVAITGWELVAGAALGGGEGTTVGQVVRPERTPTATPEPTPGPTEPSISVTPTPEPTEPEPSPQPSESMTPEPSPLPSDTAEATPTPAVPEDPGASPVGESQP